MRIERTKNARRNMLFGVALRLYQIVLPFFMRSIIVYCLGVKYLGLNSLFASVLQVLNLAELGVGSAMVYSMYKPIADDDHVKLSALLRLYRTYYRAIGWVVLIVGVIITPLIPKLIEGEIPVEINIYVLYLLNLSGTVLSYWILAYRNSILQAYQRTDIISKVTIITDTIKYAIQTISLFVFKNYYYFVLAILLSQFMTNTITAVVSIKMYPDVKPMGKLPKDTVSEINGRIKDLFTAKVGTTIVNSTDTIVISAFLGLTTLAIYQNYYFIMTSILGILGVLLSACTAGIGNSLVTETLDKNYSDFKKIGLMINWVAGICVCCFLNVYQPFMKLWMGEQNLLEFGCVILMCIYFYLYITNHFMCTYKDAAGIWHEDRFRPLVASITNLVLNLIMVKYIGIFAIILSTVFSYIIVTIPWLIHNLFTVLFKRSSIDYIKQYITCFIVICLSAIISYSLCNILPDSGIFTICLRIVISIVISNIVLFVCFRNKEEFKGAVNMFNRLTKNRLHRILKIIER